MGVFSTSPTSSKPRSRTCPSRRAASAGAQRRWKGAVSGSAGVDIVFWILAVILATGALVATTAKLEASGGEVRTAGKPKAEVATERR